MKLDQFLWMAEASGTDYWVSTDTAKINAAIEDFILYHQDGYNINDIGVQDWILRNHGLSLNSISDKQMDYIAQQVEKRLR